MNKTVDSNRRRTLGMLGAAAVSSPLGLIAGCSSNSSAGSGGGSGNDLTSGTVQPTRAWASGTTDLISDDFPATSLFESGSECNLALTRPLTKGPCFFHVADREDITDGESGLPMMLCLQLVDANCQPLAGYNIEVWHANSAGLYSGDSAGSSDASDFDTRFCTENDSMALASTWCRGELVTDSEGRVNFKSLFPGWYRGRTVHIHLTVKNPEGGTEVTSQFCFTDAFCSDILLNHDQYASRGDQDTPLASDGIFSRDADAFTMNVAQNTDGSLLAWKRAVISA